MARRTDREEGVAGRSSRAETHRLTQGQERKGRVAKAILPPVMAELTAGPGARWPRFGLQHPPPPPTCYQLIVIYAGFSSCHSGPFPVLFQVAHIASLEIKRGALWQGNWGRRRYWDIYRLGKEHRDAVGVGCISRELSRGEILVMDANC